MGSVKEQRKLLKMVFYLDSKGLRSNAITILRDQANEQATRPIPDGENYDIESWLGEYADWMVSGHEDDPSYHPVVQWARKWFGVCPNCGKCLNLDDNSWHDGWLQEAVGDHNGYCSDQCSNATLGKHFRTLVDRFCEKYNLMSVTEEFKTAAVDHLWGVDMYELSDARDAFREFAEEWNAE